MTAGRARAGVSGAGAHTPRAVPLRLGTDAMGTRFEIALFGEDVARLRAAGEAALALVEEWDQRLSWFSPASTLSHVNERAGTGPVAIDRELHALLTLCRDVWRDSSGAFDVTIAPLMVAWGFRGAAVQGPVGVEEARRRVGMDKVVLGDRPPTVELLTGGMSLDLGSVAKGAALDAAGALLRRCGVASALMHGGTSSVVAIGSPPGEEGWRIAFTCGAGHRVVSLRDQCLSVSAPRGRTIMTSLGPAGHVMDPRTGAPCPCSGTVGAIYECGALADAWSTALLVLGRRPPAAPADLLSFIDVSCRRENAA